MTSSTSLRTDLPEFTPEPAALPFSARHIGPDAAAVARMLDVVGLASTEELVERAVPAGDPRRRPRPARGPRRDLRHRRPARARRPQPGRALDDRPRLLRHPHPRRGAPQRPGGPLLVHRLHALPAGDLPGPPRGAAELPDRGHRPHRARRRQRLAAGRGDRRRRGDDAGPAHLQGAEGRRVRRRRRRAAPDPRRAAHPSPPAGHRPRRDRPRRRRPAGRGGRARGVRGAAAVPRDPGPGPRPRPRRRRRARPRRASRSPRPTCWR